MGGGVSGTQGQPAEADEAGGAASRAGQGSRTPERQAGVLFEGVTERQELEGSQGHRQPEAFGACGVGHAGVFPVPEAALPGAEILLNPGSQAIPGHRTLLRVQVGQETPGVCIPDFPAGQEGAGET